jgi:hypothetical protein
VHFFGLYCTISFFFLKSFEVKLFCCYWKENSSWRSPSNFLVPIYQTDGHTFRSFSLLDAGCRLAAVMAAQLARLLRYVVCSGEKNIESYWSIPYESNIRHMDLTRRIRRTCCCDVTSHNKLETCTTIQHVAGLVGCVSVKHAWSDTSNQRTCLRHNNVHHRIPLNVAYWTNSNKLK